MLRIRQSAGGKEDLVFLILITIEPLAETLGVSVLEIMRAERTTLMTVSNKEAEAVLIDSFELVRKQRKMERRSAAIMIIVVASIITMILFNR